jgi:hypothetical protein
MTSAVRRGDLMQRADPASRRHAVAEAVAAGYAANPKVAGVLLAGSVARGLADDFSDVEVDVFWHDAPTVEDRRDPLTRGGWLAISAHVDEHEWADTFRVDGVNVDTSQFLVETIDAWIDRVVSAGDPEPEFQVRITAIRLGQPLYRPELVDRWRARTDTYPDALAHAMVRKGVDLWPRARLQALAARDDVLLLHSDLVDNVQLLLDMLMGLNRMYAPHPWHKWLDAETAQLAVAPEDLNRRIRALLTADAHEAADDVGRLVDETIALVERHLPSFDARELRAAFEEVRAQ